MHIREFQPSDFPILLHIFYRTVREINSRDYSQDQVEAWAPDMPDINAWHKRLSSGHVWVCEIEGKVVGFTRIEANGYIDLLYVHPEHQRQGIASALLKKIVLWARSRSISFLSTESSITARPFFQKFGFSMVKSQKVVRKSVEFDNFAMKFKL